MCAEQGREEGVPGPGADPPDTQEALPQEY